MSDWGVSASADDGWGSGGDAWGGGGAASTGNEWNDGSAGAPAGNVDEAAKDSSADRDRACYNCGEPG